MSSIVAARKSAPAAASCSRVALPQRTPQVRTPAARPISTSTGMSPTTSAADGVEALAALRAAGADPFDLLLTDIWMPNLDGEGLARAVRDDPALRGLRVVAVTADVEFPSKAAAAGFDGVLLKPVTADKLASILRARA